MIRLITSYYIDKNKERQLEIDECLKNNIDNVYIDEILLLCESLPNIKHRKIKIIETNRPTFKNFLFYINKNTSEDDINILANTDIFFDDSLNDLKQFKDGFGNDDWIIGFGFDAAQQYNVKALDTTLIIDENGNIIYRDNGIPADIKTLRRLLI